MRLLQGKSLPLVDRSVARDLFDARCILSIEGLDWSTIKAAVLAIGACMRADWRDASIDSIVSPADSLQKLFYCLPGGHISDIEDMNVWVKETVELCRERFAFLFNLSANEQAFLDGVLGRGEINANLLDADDELRARIGAMPMLAWKTFHVRKHVDKMGKASDEDASLVDTTRTTQDVKFRP